MFDRHYREIRELEADIEFYIEQGSSATAGDLTDQLYDITTRAARDITVKIAGLTRINPEDPKISQLQCHLSNFREYANKCLKFRQGKCEKQEASEDASNIEVYEDRMRDSADEGRLEDVEIFRKQIYDEASEQLAKAHAELKALFMNQPRNLPMDRVNQLKELIENCSNLVQQYKPDSYHYQTILNQAKANSWKVGYINPDE